MSDTFGGSGGGGGGAAAIVTGGGGGGGGRRLVAKSGRSRLADMRSSDIEARGFSRTVVD